MKNNIKTKGLTLESPARITKAAGVLLSLGFTSVAYAALFPMPFSASADTTFQVNVRETLSVAVTTPDEWASGTPTTTTSTDFLRNPVTLSVTSNNNIGFTALMYAETSASDKTSLVNTSKTTEILETLPASTATSGQQKSSFPANYWGYSLDVSGTNVYNNKTYNETEAGNNDSNYYPLATSSSPDTILTGDNATTGTRNIYFGAKADATKASGTYAGTVVISVVTGVVNNGNSSSPTVPDNPAVDNGPEDDNPSYAETYGTGGNSGWTVYTSVSSGPDTTTTTTQVTEGDVRSSYPLGVTENTTSNISSDSPLANGLAITAMTAAAAGFFFFIVAKRREDDDEEEQ